jgi:hypothetical protein
LSAKGLQGTEKKEKKEKKAKSQSAVFVKVITLHLLLKDPKTLGRKKREFVNFFHVLKAFLAPPPLGTWLS